MGGYNQNSGYGAAFLNALHAQIPAMGRVFIVVSSSDAGEERYDRLSEVFKPFAGQVRIFTSLSDAYDAATTNNNDVICLDADSVHELSSGLAISKNRINFIGMDGGDRLVQQGARVKLVTAATTAYVIKNTGTRNSFRNIKFIQAATAGTGLNVVQDGSEGVLYKNCSFVFEVANNLGGTTAHEFLAGSDSGTYINCTFGNDTLLTSGARSVFHIDIVTAGQEFKSNILRNCNFIISSSSGTATFVRLDAITDILFANIFDNCRFVASVDSAGGAAIAEASQTGTGTNKGTLCYFYPATSGVTDFATATGGRNAATYILAPVPTAGTAGLGIAPTA